MKLTSRLAQPLIATGGHMKNAVALGAGERAIVSPHIGDLDSPRSLSVFEQTISDLQRLYGARAERIVCDLHQGYAGTRWARGQGLPVIHVQHHRAHASALAGEYPHIARWLVFAWDGVGLGEDGTLWGGEAFTGSPGEWRRAASWRPFRLTGGDRAGREPRRAAAALFWEERRERRFAADPEGLAAAAWREGINVFETSAVGRLFDAAANLVTGIEKASFEGEGPMRLEAIARAGADAIALPLRRDGEGLLRSDWTRLLDMLCDEMRPAEARASAFHASLARALADQAAAIRKDYDFDAVGLTGGVFQNRLLSELASANLAAMDIELVMPQILPANDGGLAFGQIVEAQAMMEREAR